MSRYLACLVLLFAFSSHAFLERYIIPKDKDVITIHNAIETHTKLNPEQINILVWNIYKGQRKTFAYEFAELVTDKDILLIQEGLVDQTYLNKTNLLEDFEFIFATSWMDFKQKNLRTGVYNASKAKAVRVDWYRSFFTEPITNTPKMQIFTEYELAGVDEKLLVGNIHAINFVRVDKFQHMLDQAAEVIRTHTGPIIFAGDFNTHLNSRFTYMLNLIGELGLEMVEFSLDNRKKFFGRYFDFAFTKGLKVKNAVAPKVTGSDHNPMILELSLL